MAKEIDSELSIVKMELSHKINSLPQLLKAVAFATTSIPSEVRVKYYRDEGYSTVRADVTIEAHGKTEGLTLQAIVQVILTYKGDMVRASTRTQDKVTNRLHKLAQKYCKQEMVKEIIKTSSKK